MMAYSEDHIALAAEYALGTLDADERAQVETMMAVDKEFTAMVQAWEHRLGSLNQMVGSVEPRPIVWEKIKAAIGHAEPQPPLVLPEPPPPPPKPPGCRSCRRWPTPSRQRRPARRHCRPTVQRHPVVRAGCGAGAASLRSRPRRGGTGRDDRRSGLSAGSAARGHSSEAATQVVEVKTPAAPAAPSAQYVAVLQQEGGSPAFILTVDAATKNFTVRKVGAAAEPGKSFELWLISDKLPQPRSLGVIGGSDFTARPVLSSYDANTDQCRDLCGDGRAGRRIAGRQAALGADL